MPAGSSDILEHLDNIPGLDWGNFEEAAWRARDILEEAASSKGHLRLLFENSLTDSRLFAMAEHFDRIDLIILYDDLSRGMRIRLHIYPPDHFDGPHNHRWSFTSFILAGSYCHRIFRIDDEIDESTCMLDLQPSFIMQECAGVSYTLHHSVIHSVIALPDTVSLILRGPVEKDRLLMTDLKTGKMCWKYGWEKETVEERKDRAITAEYFDQLRQHLIRLNVI